jgi:hypothetical protein
VPEIGKWEGSGDIRKGSIYMSEKKGGKGKECICEKGGKGYVMSKTKHPLGRSRA